MTLKRLVLLLIFVSVPVASRTADAARVYTNPVLDADFPDPMVLKAPDGFYYAYATHRR